MALIVIVGPTASGKTAVSIDVAQDLNAVIVSADSRSIYRGMDIGTAKPTVEERSGVSHWGFDLVDPATRYSAAEFKFDAEKIINPRQLRGEHTVMVGGTGLYVDSVVLDYTFPQERGIFTVSQVEQMSRDELLSNYKKYNITLPHDWNNLRRLQANLLRDFSKSKRRNEPIDDCYVVGIATERSVLKGRIKQRVDEMFKRGVVEETSSIMEEHGLSGDQLPGNVYPIVARLIDGGLNLADAKEMIYSADWQLARRQLTWLRRNKFIEWLAADEVREFVQGKIK